MKIFIVVITIWLGFVIPVEARDLKASLPSPPVIDTTKSPFVELIKLIDEVYTDGNITIELYPFRRSINNVENGSADFHLPLIHNPLISSEKLQYRPIHEALGKTVFVIYSHIDNPITREKIDHAKHLTQFPYTIKTIPGHAELFDFPIQELAHIKGLLQMLQQKRIDGFIMSQDETDALLRQLKTKDIHREYYQTYDDIPIVRKDSNGDDVDRILSAALVTLKNNGQLEKLWENIHKPYESWQPADMNW